MFRTARSVTAGRVIIGRVIFAPFLFIYRVCFFLLLAFLFVLVQIGIISYAFQALGLPPGLAFAALVVSLIGSYANVPVSRIESSTVHPLDVVGSFGVRYRLPRHLYRGYTTIAINLGGAVVPVLVSAYVLARFPEAIIGALFGTVIVTLVVHRFARAVPGLGIATPMLIPPIVAALAGYLLGGPHCVGVVAYVSGVMGTLIGADLMNLSKIADLGAPVAAIGGAGTFDGIFLTGIVAVLLS